MRELPRRGGLAAFAICFGSVSPAFAQGAPTPPTVAVASASTLQGRIEDAASHRPLAGALVRVIEADRSTTTDEDGRYVFVGLPQGSYTLSVSYGSSEPHDTQVEVPASGGVTKDIAYTRTSVTRTSLQTLVVTAQRTPIGAARAIQESAPNMINVLPVEEIQKLPDVNAAEAIRRVPGVSLEADTGEGRFINIRGLDADLNSTTFGGVRLPPTNLASPSGSGRAVAYDSIPAGLIGAMTVTKTNLPEQDAEALGGTIEITPKTVPQNGKPFINGKIGSGFEPLRDTPIYDGELTAGGRFGFGSGNSFAAKPFSILGTVDYYDDRRGIDDLEASYTDQQANGVPDKVFSSFEQRYYRYHRRRLGFGGELAYQPDQGDRWYLRYFQGGYGESVNRQRLLFGNLDNSGGVTDTSGNALPVYQPDPSNPNGFIAPAAQFSKTLRDEHEDLTSRVLTFGGRNDFDTMQVDYRGSFAVGTYRKPFDYNTTFSDPNNATLAYDNTSDPNYPSYRVVSGDNPTDPTKYTLTGFNNGTEDDRDQEWTGVGNVTIPTHFTDAADENLKFGLSGRFRDRHQAVNVFNYDGLPTLPLTSAITNEFVTYYDGHYENGYNIDSDTIRNLYFNDSGAFTRSAGQQAADQAGSAAGTSHDTENVYAGYGQYQFGFGKWDLIAGLRLEDTETKYAANAVSTQTDSSGNTTYLTQPVSQSASYFDYFPTVQARYAFRPDLIGRLIYSSAISRPGFNQVTAATNINPGGNFVSQGNPNLKPTTSDSFDADLEYYFSNAGILSFGVFEKQLNNYIVTHEEDGVIFPNSGLFAGFTGPAKVFTFTNVPTARLMGAEFNYEQRFRQLPGVLSGLGAGLNYTYVQSSLEIRPGDRTQLPSSSRNTMNATLFYEKDGVDLRVAAYYVSKNIFNVGGSAATDVWSQARFSVDFGSSYAFNRHLKAYFNAKNLTNTPLKFTEGPNEYRPIQREFYDTTFQGGFRFDF